MFGGLAGPQGVLPDRGGPGNDCRTTRFTTVNRHAA
jgi:hypothetical protein